MRVFFSILSIACLISTGCGSSNTDVSGTVTLSGKPLQGGSLFVFASDGSVHNTTIDSEGKFTLTNIPLGEAKYGVMGTNTAISGKVAPPGRGGEEARGGRNPNPNTPAPRPEGTGTVIPEPYRDPSTSGLTFTVKKGESVTLNLP